MSGLVFLIPIALLMGLAGLAGFVWAVRAGQFDDPDGAAARILLDTDAPLQKPAIARTNSGSGEA
ncbi:MAG: cbb3-type cytochrome oxidase assembly protein CcoS [Hyphomonas sp.]|nr:cbb3-type cytochrome oxidase assembly protein CcoS [Hyphomonas sp.]